MKNKIQAELIPMGLKMKEVREIIGLNQDDFAFIFGTTAPSLRSIELGYNYNTALPLLITRTLKLDWADFNNPRMELPPIDRTIINNIIKKRTKNDDRYKKIVPRPKAAAIAMYILPKTEFMRKEHSLEKIREYIRLEEKITYNIRTLRSALNKAVNAGIIKKKGGGKGKEDGVRYYVD